MNKKEISKLLLDIKKLKEENQKLKSRKKYGLVWENKSEQIALQCKTKLPILKEVKDKEIKTNKKKPTNILIEGDNYHALQVLNYTHKGKVDVIYIDPPYNTGASSWKYNNDYVDKEDVWRHSKWLSFIEKRLKLAKNLLRDSGIICITIDENEQAQLKLLCDDIFGENNYLGTVCIRNNPSGRTRKSEISLQHEYALFYSKNKNIKGISTFYVAPKEKTHNYKIDENEQWYEKRNLRRGRKKEERPKRFFPIYVNPESLEISITKKPKFVEILPINDFGQELTWDREKEMIESLYKKKEIWAEKTKNGYKVFFKFRPNLDVGETPKSIWADSKYSSREYGVSILKNLFGESPFEYPKSLYAVVDCIKAMNTQKEIIILDFFAGSGTTGHAVLELNNEDGGRRKFILCTNNENNICTEVCYPRIEKVIKGYNFKGKDKKLLFEKKLNFNQLKIIDNYIEEIDKIIEKNIFKFDKVDKKLENNTIKITGIKKINDFKDGLGGNLKYFKTDFIDVDSIYKVSDSKKLNLTYQAGELIAIKEDVFEELEKNEYYQIFKNDKKVVGIYFIESHKKLNELLKKINKYDLKKIIYLFSWGKTEYTGEDLGYSNIKIKDIPQPIIDVYKEINKLYI